MKEGRRQRTEDRSQDSEYRKLKIESESAYDKSYVFIKTTPDKSARQAIIAAGCSIDGI